MPSWTQLWPVTVVAAISWLARSAPAITILAPISGTSVAPTGQGVGVSPSPLVAVTRVVPAVAIAVQNSGTIQPVAQNAITAQSTLSAILSRPIEAMRVVSTTTDLTQTTNCVTATSTGTWVNPANAQGPTDAAYASSANSVTVAASGALTLAFAAQFNKTQLSISSVVLGLYWEFSAPAALPGTNLLEYSLDSGSTWTTILTSQATQTYRTVPMTVSLTAAVGQSWASLTNLRVRHTFTAAAGAPTLAIFEAAQLTVTASQTVLS